jgi:hypothetical protein
MKRKVFIHYNESGVPDNDIVVVTTFDGFTPTNNEYHRQVTEYAYASFQPFFFGMMTFDDTEVHTTWIHSNEDDVFSADARARDAELGTDVVIA